MSQCFCGCGEEFGITKRKQRQASETGAETTRLLNELDQFCRPWIEAGRPGFEDLPMPPEMPTPEEQLAEMVSEGNAMRNDCLAVAHGMLDASMPKKREVKEWLHTAYLQVTVARMPVESRQRVATALSSGTGEDLLNAFEAGEQATRR